MTITLEKINKARELGASDDQIFNAIQQYDPDMYSRIETARNMGASNDQIMKGIETRLANVKLQPAQQPVNQSPQIEQPGFFERTKQSFQRGLGSSVSGLLAGPEQPRTEEPGIWDTLVETAGMLTGDAPYIAAGAQLGAAIGGVGGSVVPGAGTTVGGVAGGSIGALALPGFIKSALREYHDYAAKGHDLTFGEFLSRADRVASETLREGVNGLILGNIKKIIPQIDKFPGLEKLFSSKIGQKAAEVGLETAALGTLPAISEGRLPKANEFATGLALALGFRTPDAVFAAKTRYEKYLKDKKIEERDITDEKVGQVAELVKNGIPEQLALDQIFTEKQPETLTKKVIETENAQLLEDSGKISISQKPLSVEIKPEAKPEKKPEPITEETGVGATEQLDFTPNRTERIIKATNNAIEVVKDPKNHIVKTGQAINEGVFNFLAPLERLEKDIPIEDRPSVYIDRALSANSTINSILENGIFSDITGQLEHQGLKDAYGTEYVWRTRTNRIKSPNEASIQELSVYRTAKQALKRQSEGKKTGIDTQQAQEEVAKLGSKYEPIAQRIRQFQRDVTSTFGNDLLGQDGVAYWNKDYYSPMYRVMDTGDNAMLSSNALTPKKPWFKFKGSQRKIIDPKESDQYNAAMLIQNDLKNKAVLKYRDGVINGTLPGKIVKAKIEEIPEPLRRELEEKGLDFNDDQAVEQATKLYNQTRANSFNPSNTTLRGWKDGKPFDIIVPEEVGRVFRGIEPQQRPYYARFFDFFNRAFNKQFRIDPQKFASITARDLLNATIWGRSGLSPRTAFKALGEAMFGSDAYKQFLQEGGDSYAARFATRLDRAKNIDEFVTPGYEGPVYPLNRFMDFLKDIGKKQDALAVAVPFQEYLKGVNKYGNTPSGRVKAMYDAKRVTYNPNRKGGSRLVREIAPFINWFNISLQDLSMNANNLKKPEAWARAASILTLPTLALKFANEGNPDYDNLTMEDKLGYWHIFYGDTHYRLALPWLMGTLFKVVPEAMYDSAVNGNHQEAIQGVFDNFVDQTTGSLNPILRAFVVTSTGKTPAEWLGFRTKAPEVVPKRLQNLPAEYQFTENTSQLSRGIGSALGISPMIADRVAQELGGTISKRTLGLIDEIAYQTGIAEDKRPEKQISNYVSIGNFITDSTPTRTKYTKKFYELWEEYQTTKAAIKFGVPDKSLERFGNIANVKKRIDRGMREYRDIEQSATSKSEKRKALKEKQLELNALYKEAVENIKE